MTIEVEVLKNSWVGEKLPTIRLHNNEALTPRADFVRDLVARWGMVQALDAGEDSTGRHKFELMSPSDVVNRAMEMSDLMYKAFAENDMIIKLPSFDEMQAIADEMIETDRSEVLLDKITARNEAREAFEEGKAAGEAHKKETEETETE